MKAPLSWLGEFVDLPADVNPRAVAEALIRVGMEVEGDVRFSRSLVGTAR